VKGRVGIWSAIQQQLALHWTWLVGITAVLFPLSVLLPINSGFYVDWYNHLWQIAYYGQYFAVHHTMPLVLNTTERVLIEYPTFYGFLFYPLIGGLSSFLGPNLAVRLAILALWALKFLLVYRAAYELSGDRILGVAIGCLVSWEIYPLTNLYNRSALTELFSAGLVTCALCSVLLVLVVSDPRRRIAYVLVTGLTLGLAVTTHPITALYAVPFLGLMLLVGAPFALRLPKKEILFLAGSGFVVCAFLVLVVAPWAYATITSAADMQISVNDFRISSSQAGVPLFPDDIDNFFSRFALFPYDGRTLLKGLNVSTPFLDAQINMPLFLLLTGLVVFGKQANDTLSDQAARGRQGAAKALFGTSLFLFCFASVLSLSDLPYYYLPAVFRLIQFPYRVVTYQNLALLAAALSWIAVARVRFPLREVKLAFLVACLTLAATSTLVKFSHARIISEASVTQSNFYDLNPIDPSKFLSMPKFFYGLDSYTVQLALPPAKDDSLLSVPFPVGQGHDFGAPLQTTVNLSGSNWVETDVAASRWNSVLVDGVQVPWGDLRSKDAQLVVQVPPGRHTLEARFMPDDIFIWFRQVSFGLFVLWLCAAIGLIFFIMAKDRGLGFGSLRSKLEH
jgi:hypothetical protein